MRLATTSVTAVFCGAVLFVGSLAHAQKGESVRRKINRIVVAFGANTFDHPSPPGSKRTDDGWEPLRYAEKDAREVVEALEYYGFEPFNDTILLGEEATSYALWQQLTDLRRDIHKHGGEDYEVVIYLSSHGFNLDPEGDEQGFIVARNTPARKDFRAALKQEAISQKDILELFVSELGPNVLRTAIIYDACETPGGKGAASRLRGAGASSSMKVIRQSEKSLQQIRDLTQTTYVFSAVSRKQPAVEPKELGNGVYTHYLLKALRGGKDGPASEYLPDVPFSLFAAHQFATHKVQEWTKGRQYPSWAAPRVNEAEGLFFLWPEGTPERSASLKQGSMIITTSPPPPRMMALLIPKNQPRTKGQGDSIDSFAIAMGGGTIVTPGQYTLRLIGEDNNTTHIEADILLGEGEVENLNLIEMLDSRPNHVVGLSAGVGSFTALWGTDAKVAAMPTAQLSYGLSGWPWRRSTIGARLFFGNIDTDSPAIFDTTVNDTSYGLSLEVLGEGNLGAWTFGLGPQISGVLLQRHIADINQSTLTSAWGGGAVTRIQTRIFGQWSFSIEGHLQTLAIGQGGQGLFAASTFAGLSWNPVIKYVGPMP